MNKLRKIIALMLSLSVIFTAAISVFSAENFDDDGNRDNDAGLAMRNKMFSFKTRTLSMNWITPMTHT